MSDVLTTIQEGEVYRLMPGDQVIVKIWVTARRPTDEGDLRRSLANTPGTLRLKGSDGRTIYEKHVLHLKGDGEEEVDPLLRDVPQWWEEAKLGIFMHWGIYAVPGWAPPGPYAEWYWYHQHHEDYDSWSFWTHHLNTYGKDFVYDDFIPQVGSKFNASEIVRIVAASGAKYFIPTTMHHDGFCIFDSKNATRRSSVHLGPQRDFLGELFDAAKKEQPHLRRGTYFSMVEWYNPNVGDGGYGWGTWPGWLARNAYDTSKEELYTGVPLVEDWLRDEQLAKMKILAEDYETEVMWCDIGGPNMTREFLEDWLPFADKKNLQVAMNNRCGTRPQFDTPEYTKFSSIQYSKWESTESVDPHSFGYNRLTAPHDYRSAYYLIHTLVDIVSKNGNYLLNIGPDGDGVVPPPVVGRLLEMGHWLGHSGGCIYGTQTFYPGAEFKALRFTRTPTTFCIISLHRPQDEVVIINTHIPLLENDTISLLGAGDVGKSLQWANLGGTYIIKVPEVALNKVNYAWAFQVEYAM
ncbi:glycoside hydrolase superfamily [Cantharellus anzutake]|uniref:glycoside hydrolase superfamily n=1 Tax=Cantharellus anzutake TaxID=1750568 RepID=UPI001907C68E|nr:glycoside hydrolase superfamily [Cantharellus anzutake]KAF8329349.1 glycoside hydrolase superfamily [Cantharellus anzutake]